MPSDAPLEAALTALAPGIRAFRAHVGDALAHVERQLVALNERDDIRQDRYAVELGDFAAGRIDAARFASIVAGVHTLDVDEVSTLYELRSTLQEFERAPDSRFVVDVPSGGEPGHFLGDALADFGRAFGAATAAELMRTGRFTADAHRPLLEPMPPARWTAAQRAVSPPLVLSVDGIDLRAGGLSPYLDAAQKIVVVVRGACPPAPLVRLITPGVLVVQANTSDALKALDACSGPAVIALVPEGAATFVNEPAAGVAARSRLTVTFAPALPRRALGDWSPFQQQQELLQLMLLAAGGPAPASNGNGVTAAPPSVEQLATWLLAQAADAARP